MKTPPTITEAVDVLGEAIVTKVLALSDDAADKFISKMEVLIAERKAAKSKPTPKDPSRDQLVKEFNTFGFQVPSNAKFFKVVKNKTETPSYGMLVGHFTHSCHVDTTDFVVLLFPDGRIDDVDSLWLPEIK